MVLISGNLIVATKLHNICTKRVILYNKIFLKKTKNYLKTGEMKMIKETITHQTREIPDQTSQIKHL